MFRYLVVGFSAGLLFAVMDGVVNANSFARRLLECYKPIARQEVKAGVGLAIDLAYGFIMAAIFLLIARSLPGPWIAKGLWFGLIAWFFRVVMATAGSYVVFNVPAGTLLYTLATGLVEMVTLGVLFGLALRV